MIGACFLPDGTCQVVLSSDCVAAAGAYMGNWTIRSEVACEPTPVRAVPGDEFTDMVSGTVRYEVDDSAAVDRVHVV